MASDDLLWYASYGSNMSVARFGCYLAGGRPEGALREQPGCRDARPALDDRPVHLDGTVYFALESRTWRGGLALYDPTTPGRAAARAYLVTREQLCDLAAQEMHREPAAGLDSAMAAGLDRLCGPGTGARLEVGPGRYEVLVRCGEIDDRPVVTFTAPWTVGRAPLNPPSAAYVRTLAAGLADAHGWAPAETAGYLVERPGTAPAWSRDRLEAVAEQAVS